MLKKWLLAGAVVLGGSAFVAHEADAFGHHRRGHRGGGCSPCGGGYTQPAVVQQPVSGGCCGSSYSSGCGSQGGYSQGGYGSQGGYSQGGYGQSYSAGYGSYDGGYGYGNQGYGVGVNTGLRGVDAGVNTGVRGVVGGIAGR